MGLLYIMLTEAILASDCHEEEAIYCCCDAKFMAESASDVGKDLYNRFSGG